MSYRKKASEYAEIMKTYRRDLHRIPEIKDDLPETKSFIMERLGSYDCEIDTYMKSGITAYFDNGKDMTLAFRTDMDALEIEEKTKCSYRSAHEGFMHACGHDGHMSMILALAKYCDETPDLPVNVLLIFEPNEEGLGGAENICKTGIMDEKNVEAVFGIHMYPFGEKGVLTTRQGPLMAHSAEINVLIQGESVHAAEKRGGIDAIEAAAEFIYKVHKMRAEETPKGKNTIISFGVIEGGTVKNILADHVNIKGTMRGYDSALFSHLQDKIREIAAETGASTGAGFFVNFSAGYPAVINSSELYEKVRPILEDEGVTVKQEPEMISDDFSFFGRCRPALYMFLGTGTNKPLHTDDFDFDEDVLVTGLSIYIDLVNNYTKL